VALLTTSLLRRLQALIGASATGLGPVDVDTGNISLTLPTVPEIARRGLAPGNIGGWGIGVLENVHGAADFESSSIDPYQPGDAAVGAYPSPVPLDFDVWLLGATAIQTVGTAGLDGAFILINPVASQQMWGRDDTGDPVVTDPPMVLGRWDAVDSAVTGSSDVLITEAGETYIPINMRIPRSGCLIVFHTESAGIAEYQATLLMGLFPAALGQDVVT